jgi:hypothetical protein
VEWSGVEWSGVEWSGVEWSGVEWSGVERIVMYVCSASFDLFKAFELETRSWNIEFEFRVRCMVSCI